MKKLVVLTAGAVAAGTVGLLSAGSTGADPMNPNQANVIGEPYYKAVRILKGMGFGTGFGGSVGSALPQAQCMVSSQKLAGNNRMLLNLDCTEEAAQQMAEQGSLGTGAAPVPGRPNDGTLRPPQIPIAPAPAPAG
ncbi:hypothetical protein [Mycobacterium sp. 1274761.0]|uniref:hypothetical protein n=1 Tax=Mycobacterium sp. 1274761.0 TaxID=1834077 RepID=UPI000800C30B|nr:hypothetical protein [Mycobacterium sp. 1274761.0]OBK78760.1 hypothetical protein A5651_02240 [Mycobacterium sp. 1274761.0]